MRLSKERSLVRHVSCGEARLLDSPSICFMPGTNVLFAFSRIIRASGSYCTSVFVSVGEASKRTDLSMRD